MRASILLDAILVYMFIVVHKINSHQHFGSDALLCRMCGIDVGYSKRFVNLFSPHATTVQLNQSWLGINNIDVQVLQSPIGIKFRIVTLKQADCVSVDEWQKEYTWFPGYVWKHCVCSRNGHHLGWMFEPISTAKPKQTTLSPEGFYAIILDNILSERFSDSLILPRMLV